MIKKAARTHKNTDVRDVMFGGVARLAQSKMKMATSTTATTAAAGFKNRAIASAIFFAFFVFFVVQTDRATSFIALFAAAIVFRTSRSEIGRASSRERVL